MDSPGAEKSSHRLSAIAGCPMLSPAILGPLGSFLIHGSNMDKGSKWSLSSLQSWWISLDVS